eukprot:snap_masked-scaffold_23-processed-gene-4.4-mRNA-1 protein AED:1.00 eAED:1.00 QI:0/-1/0/0/-1/1/1/0/64
MKKISCNFKKVALAVVYKVGTHDPTKKQTVPNYSVLSLLRTRSYSFKAHEFFPSLFKEAPICSK